MTVPLPAVQNRPDGLFVYVTKPDGTVGQRDVQVGYQNDATAVVTKGLEEGETVVVDGQLRVISGKPVLVKEGESAAAGPTKSGHGEHKGKK